MLTESKERDESVIPKCIDCGEVVIPFKGKFLCKNCRLEDVE